MAITEGTRKRADRESVRALREAGLLGVRMPAALPLPREIIEQRAIESVETEPPPRFPRTALVLEAAELADKCRVAAATLDALAANASDYEPSTLRRHAHGVIRVLFAELAARVVLVLTVLALAVACGGAAEPEPLPLECEAIDWSGYCNDAGCVRDFRCNRPPGNEFGEAVTCEAAETAGVYRCRW